jgi:RNA polymerase sigma-70 factor, ECF subfamily
MYPCGYLFHAGRSSPHETMQMLTVYARLLLPSTRNYNPEAASPIVRRLPLFRFHYFGHYVTNIDGQSKGFMDSQSDEQLMILAQNGSEHSFNVLVDRYTPMVFRVAFGITGIREEAEDVVQETFLKVFKHLESFAAEKASFKTWLLTITRNQSINVFSSIKRKTIRFLNDLEPEEMDRAHFDYSADSYCNPEDELCLRQEYSRMQDALKCLPERQRTALLLKVMEGMTYEAIARIMGNSCSSVESLIFRARKKLMEILDSGS